MKLVLIAGAVAAMLLSAACGDPEIVTVGSLTREFCEGVEGMMDMSAEERIEEFEKMNARIDEKLLEGELDDEALAFNVLAECGEELIELGSRE